MLLHVLSQEAQDSPITFVPYPESENFYNFETFEILQKEWEKFRQESREFLRKLAEEANREGVETEFTQLAGNPAYSIVKFSQDWGAELIIMGRRGQATWKEIVLGSVSSYVIHRSHCAVHLVQT